VSAAWTGGVSVSESGPYRIITIFNGEKNLLNPGVMAGLEQELQRADAEESVEGVVLTGEGSVFCGGLDVPAIQAGGDPVEFATSLVSLLSLIPTLGTPITAAVNGNAVASGASLVAACDFAAGNPDVRVGTYEVSIGIWPMIAQVPLIQRIGARAAMENVGAGEPFTAARALEVGLLQRIVESGSEQAACLGWLEFASRGAKVYAGGRRSLYEFADMPYQQALQESLDRFAAMFK
jgi:enoyl-CoA hydratase/carnithine racemase